MKYTETTTAKGDRLREPLTSYNYVRRFGGNRVTIECGFCDAVHRDVSVWSLAGSGKRCGCGALMTYGGTFWDARADKLAVAAKRKAGK
jgi:hypothetical protein